MKNNMKELKLNEMEQVNGGYIIKAYNTTQKEYVYYVVDDTTRDILEYIPGSSKKAKKRAKAYGVSEKFITPDEYDKFRDTGSF